MPAPPLCNEREVNACHLAATTCNHLAVVRSSRSRHWPEMTVRSNANHDSQGATAIFARCCWLAALACCAPPAIAACDGEVASNSRDEVDGGDAARTHDAGHD